MHGSVSRHGLLDTVYPLREHLNSVQLMVSGEDWEGVFPDTVCWTRFRSLRIKHAPNCGHHFVSPAPPFFLGGLALFQYRKSPFLWEVLPFLQDLLHESTVSPTGESRGKVDANGGPQFSACLTLSD